MSEEVKYCKRGHPRTPENLSKSGNCKLCRKIYRATDKYKAWQREYSQSEKAKESCKKYAKSEIGRRKKREARKRREDDYKIENGISVYQDRYRKTKSNIEKYVKKRIYDEKWRANNIERLRQLERNRDKKSVENVDKQYCALIHKISVGDVTDELLCLTRGYLQLKREVKKCKHQLTR